MIWLSQGGGPWGTGPKGGGSGDGSGSGDSGKGGGSSSGGSGSGGSGSGGGPGGPWGGGSRTPGPRKDWPPRRPSGSPPNIEEMLRRGQERFRGFIPGGFGTGTGLAVVAVAVVAIWLASGVYRVQPDEVGVVLRFGAYNRTIPPGLGYHLPNPIEAVLRPKVTRVNRTEIGYRAAEATTSRPATNRQQPEEALMLTGDENIVDVNFAVFWVIKDARAFLFNIKSPEQTVRSGAESAMREVVGHTPIAAALAEGRRQIEVDTQHLLQQILDAYGAGIEVTQLQLLKVDPPGPVIDAFRDVQRARADQESKRNQAEAYRNEILPRARGDAVKLVQDAEAYRQEIVARAQGEAQRFVSVYTAFKAAKDVTLRRLYLETMEEILKNGRKVIIDRAADGGTGVTPYLPLPELGRGASPAAAPNGQGSQPASAAPSATSRSSR